MLSWLWLGRLEWKRGFLGHHLRRHLKDNKNHHNNRLKLFFVNPRFQQVYY